MSKRESSGDASARRNPARWWPWIAAATLALFGALLLTPTLGDLGGDSAQYLSLAESLASGGGYRDVYLPDCPAHGHYPPGFPSLLVPLVWAFGKHAFLPARMLVLACGVAALFLCYRLLARRAGSLEAGCAVLLAATAANLVTISTLVYSELPYLLAAVLALLALEHEPATKRSLGFATGFALAAFAIRMAGVAVLAALASVFVRRFGWRKGAVLTGLAFLVPIAFYVYASATTGTQSYTEELSALSGGHVVGHVWHGVVTQFLALGTLVGNSPIVGTGTLLSAILSGVVLTGFFARLRGGLRPLEVFYAASFVIAACAPQSLDRYQVPLLPFSALYALEAMRLVARWAGDRVRNELDPVRLRKVAVLAFAVLLGVAHLVGLFTVVGYRFRDALIEPPGRLIGVLAPVQMSHWQEGQRGGEPKKLVRYWRRYADFLMVLEAIRKAVPADAILASRKPRLVSYLTGRHCVPTPEASDRSTLVAKLQARGVTHLVLDSLFAQSLRYRKWLGRARAEIGIRSAACLRPRTLRAGPQAPAPR